MLINFCHPCLNPILSCDKICRDGYEISNLIAVDSFMQKGFSVDYFIKPPVTITVQLINNIDLTHVIIYPRLGSQKSTSFEVHVAVESDLTDFHKIGIGCIQNSEDCIVFSKKHEPDSPLKSVSIPFVHKLFFYRTSNVRKVSIKITRTLNSSVPSLKKVEIWGRLSANCDPRLKNEIEKLWIESTRDFRDEEESNDELDSESEEVRNTNELNVPEEFSDVITCDIMALPMLLPSGKIVDQSTLDRCARADAQYGRSPCDPFTGEVFTDCSKPIFLPSLKVRIDKFLNENAHHEIVRRVSRTVGKRKSAGTNSFFKKFCNPTSSCRSTQDFSASNQSPPVNAVLGNENSVLPEVHNSEINSSSVVNVGPSGGRSISSKSDREIRQNRAASRNIETICIDESDSTDVIDLSDDNCSTDVNTLDSVPGNNIFSLRSHNVDIAMKKTLANLPSFTQSKRHDVSTQNLCGVCFADSNLYYLPCYHFLCRSCLLSSTRDLKVSCSKCNSEFSSSEPVRYHQ